MIHLLLPHLQLRSFATLKVKRRLKPTEPSLCQRVFQLLPHLVEGTASYLSRLGDAYAIGQRPSFVVELFTTGL